MASSRQGQVIRFTADNDTFDFGLKVKLCILGARLVAGSGADATAQIHQDDTNGPIMLSMAAVQKTDTEHSIPFTIDAQILHVDISGAGAEVYLYVG